MIVSIVIPTWNEAAGIAVAVGAARAIADEVIVADGGSTDETRRVAAVAGATVLLAPKNRGAQLHAGARACRGDVLLFLHADTRLPPAARRALEMSLADSQVIGGNFRLEFRPPCVAAALFTVVNDWRRSWLRIYYGDSAIFVRKDRYEALGGFAPLPLFEDYDFARRLEAHGETTYIRDVPVEVSARRFLGRPVRTLLRWALLQGLFSLGVPAERLAGHYADARAPEGGSA